MWLRRNGVLLLLFAGDEGQDAAGDWGLLFRTHGVAQHFENERYDKGQPGGGAHRGEEQIVVGIGTSNWRYIT